MKKYLLEKLGDVLFVIFIFALLCYCFYAGSAKAHYAKPVDFSKKRVIESLTPAPSLTRKELARKTAYGFAYIAQETGFSREFLWSYYITETGGKSNALVNGYNFGGIQPQGVTARYLDVWSGICAWIRVLNNKWYDQCRGLRGADCQRCMRERNYHMGSWQYRYRIELKYWLFFKSN